MSVTGSDRQLSICFMSATWRRDLDRFLILRESLAAFGRGHIPHYALVNTEDEAVCREACDPSVVPVPSKDLLAPEVEAGRLRYLRARGGRHWKRLKRSLYKRCGLFPDSRYYGWHIQQLLKLHAVAKLPHDVFVCFDSDNVVTADFDPAEFVADGKVILYERHVPLAPGQSASSWYVNACRLLDVPLSSDHHVDNVNQPVVFEKKAMQALHAWLERRYARPWYESLLAQKLGRWSEFMTYGVFVRHHLEMHGFVSAETNAYNLWLETEEQRRNAREVIHRAFADPGVKVLVLQADDHGRWPFAHFEPFLREELARARAARGA